MGRCRNRKLLSELVQCSNVKLELQQGNKQLGAFHGIVQELKIQPHKFQMMQNLKAHDKPLWYTSKHEC